MKYIKLFVAVLLLSSCASQGIKTTKYQAPQNVYFAGISFTGDFKDNKLNYPYSYDISKGLAGADFLCEFKGEKNTQGAFFVKIKNKVLLNDEVEIITPDEQFTAHITITNRPAPWRRRPMSVWKTEWRRSV